MQQRAVTRRWSFLVALVLMAPAVAAQEPELALTGFDPVELIGGAEVAGGDDCFPELSKESLGKNRIIENPAEVIRRAPDIIIGSWCGKKFRPERVAERAGWEAIPAVRDREIYEIKSPLIFLESLLISFLSIT